MARAEHIGKIVFQVRDDVSSDFQKAKQFRKEFGQGVPLKWGLDVFRQFVSSDETPPYVLAMGRRLEDGDSSELRPRAIATGQRQRPELDVPYRAPTTSVEADLVELWKKVLSIAPIGVDDDLFDLGGDSIEAIQVQHAINRDFDLALANTAFLDNPTIADLARLIAEEIKVDQRLEV